MRIYSMTATFGRLEHQTLTLNPGLNILEAPNEWGKSTWCAFLTAMFYGLDTRAKSTKAALADKEKYLPWSGAPMSGSICLSWQGRDITIERHTLGRVPLGVFAARETASGLPVPELTAANCGEKLLGVERSVFLRAGFLRLTDLPVTQDDALRRRLNALVTTGDDSGQGELLGQKLRELKNRCRYNRTGLLPQAEAALAEKEEALHSLRCLSAQAEKIRSRQQELEAHMAKLKNHQATLAFEDAQSDAGRLSVAQAALDNARLQEETQEFSCRDIPSRQEAEKTIQTARQLYTQWQSLHMESRMLPQAPEKPEIPLPFRGLTPEQAAEKAAADAQSYTQLLKKSRRFPVLLWLPTVIFLGIACGLAAARAPAAPVMLALGGILLVAAILGQMLDRRKKDALLLSLHTMAAEYGSSDSRTWETAARDYGVRLAQYREDRESSAAARGDLDQRLEALEKEVMALTGGQDLQLYLSQWQQVRDAWQACDDARRNRIRLEGQLQELRAMARTAQSPNAPDDLTYSAPETARLISDCAAQQKQLQLLLGQCQGKAQALGSEEALLAEISGLKARISKLDNICCALEIAQDTLAQATAELQRRFAPKITARATEFFSALTGGRYQHLRFGDDFSLSAGAQGEDILRSALWRSDGTADQLYLALRLAVAEALTPEAPLILDDALVRFDDVRLKAALALLDREAKQKQVLLFTCQSRENRIAQSL